MQKLKKKTWKLLLTFSFLFFCCINTFAQQKTVTGIISEANGDPIIGASIMVKGTTTGTTTDIDGKFSINVEPSAKTLVVTYVGMKDKEVAIKGDVLNITMESSLSDLDEVVVIGYGTVAKKDLTGAVSSIGEKVLKDIPVTSVSEAMTGRLAGVNITKTEGSPDAEIKIRVRGGGSVTQDNSPLYIVDGFIVNSINDIPPTDIQSIDVLKDAASTAIYGAQGANGVIVVTTKSGKAGKITVNFNAYWGMSKVYNLTPVMSPYEYVYMQKELDPGASVESTSYYAYYGLWQDKDIFKSDPGTDWQNELYGNTGNQANYNASISGGSDALKYNLSLNQVNEDYIMLNSGFKRTNINLKTNAKISKTIDFDFATRLSYATITGPSISSGRKLRDGVKYTPTAGLTGFSEDVQDTQDDTSPEKISTLQNPLFDIENEYKKQYQFNNTYNAGINWKIIKGLTFSTKGSYSFITNHTDNIWTKGTGESNANGGQPVAKKTNEEKDQWSFNNTLTYDYTLKDIHRFTFLLGQEMSNRNNDQTVIQSKYFPANMTAEQILAMWNYGDPLPTYTTLGEPTRLSSVFGRINYTLKDKYLLTLTAREDGTNVFSPDNRWGFFPGMAAGWRLSEESFMESQKDWLSNLKLRFSYGSVGNARVGSYWRQELGFETGATKLSYPSEEPASALKPSTTLYNAGLKWETTIATNFGIDFGVLDNRYSGTLEIYKNTVKDLIMAVPLPAHSGYTQQYQNVGQTSNRGVELTLNGYIVDTKDFTLSANFNISMNRNKVDKFVSAEGNYATYSSGWGLTTSAYDYLVEVGGPVGQMYGYVTDEMYSFSDFTWNPSANKWVLNPTDADGNKIPDITTLITTSKDTYFGPGHLKLKDLDGDGQITEADRKVIGNAQPLSTGGFGLNATYKGFDASAFFNWSYGNDIYNANKIDYNTYSGSKRYQNMSTEMGLGKRFTTIDPETGYNIYYGAYADPVRLQELNQNASIWHPIINSTVFHSWAVEDGSFLRLNNLTVGYTLPKSISQKVLIESLRVYFTGYNLYCWTNYSGQDPEVDTRRSTPLTPGVDYSAYPKSRTFIAGVNITF